MLILLYFQSTNASYIFELAIWPTEKERARKILLLNTRKTIWIPSSVFNNDFSNRDPNVVFKKNKPAFKRSYTQTFMDGSKGKNKMHTLNC